MADERQHGGVSRRRFITGAGAGAVTLAAGCTGGNSAPGGSEGDGTETATESGSTATAGGSVGGSDPFTAKITVSHWPVLMYAPPYQVAMENGYFEEEGIEIEEIVGSSGGGTTVRNVVTGGLPFGEVSTPAAVQAYYAGAPLTIISGAINTPGTINWVAPTDADISSITDLEGETVGFTSAGSVTQNTSALAVKKADGIGVDDVSFKAMGGLSEGLTAVNEGSIAVAANLDPIFSKQQAGDEQRWQTVFWAKDYIETFQQISVITGPDILENNPDIVRGFLRARQRGVSFIRENPAEAAQIFASYNDGYGADVMRQALSNAEPERFYLDREFSTDGLVNVENGMKNIDLIDRDVEWSAVCDQSFLPEENRVDLTKAENA